MVMTGLYLKRIVNLSVNLLSSQATELAWHRKSPSEPTEGLFHEIRWLNYRESHGLRETGILIHLGVEGAVRKTLL